MLLKSHHGVIEGNHFENYCSHAIAMMNTWQEFGPIAHHVTIRDNTFELSEAFAQTMLSKEHKVRLVNCGDGVRDSQEGIME